MIKAICLQYSRDYICAFGGLVQMYRAVGVLVRDYVYFVWAISVLVWLISFCFIIFCCAFEMGSVDASFLGS